ncbi:MAG: acyltransferase domain-containing protein [Pseudomonadota bacterium]|nr:acyltransferase domain-containing protein [Pseudomonadota bacterium]
MSARLLLLCPGQGGQHRGMFDLARTDARGAALIDACALSAGDPDALFANRHAQPAIVGATLAMWEALRPRLPAPALVAGYSVGELAAYGVAGAWKAPDTVRLAARRAQCMDAAAAATSPQALVAISGLLLDRAGTLAAACGFAIAIATGDDSCIAGGLEATLAALEQAVSLAGGRLQRLPVGIASHTALMSTAVAPFAEALLAAPFHPPACAVLAGISAESVTGQARAVASLSRQLSEPIVWSECMDAAAEAGMTVALELGPGAALARMLQARHPHIACRSVADFRSLDGIVAWLGRHLDQMPVA